eukprot:ctg_1044.g376
MPPRPSTRCLRLGFDGRSLAGRRRDTADGDGASRQPGAMADDRRAHRCGAAARAARPAHPAVGPGGVSAAAHRPHQTGGTAARQQRARQRPAGGRSGAAGACCRGARAGGCVPKRAAHAGGRAGAGLRLAGGQRAQNVRPVRHRNSVWQGAGTDRRDAAVSGWRGDDRERLLAPQHVRRTAAQVRGGHAGHRRRRGPGGGGAVPQQRPRRDAARAPIRTADGALSVRVAEPVSRGDRARTVVGGGRRGRSRRPLRFHHSRRAPERHLGDRRPGGHRHPLGTPLRAAAAPRRAQGARLGARLGVRVQLQRGY